MKLCECIVTWQGEGIHSGRKMTLLRFRECNRVIEKKPCKWCDTLVKMTVVGEGEYSDSMLRVLIDKTRGIMITGGEPTYSKNLDFTKHIITAFDYDICDIETNGYNIEELIEFLKENELRNVYIMYSPKIFSDEDLKESLEKIHKIYKYENLFIKVVFDGSKFTVNYLDEITNNLKLRSDQLWIMPQGITRNELIHNFNKTIDMCEKYNSNFSSRNHIIFNFI